ncbi:MAG: ATP-binding protein [Bacteroidetes bacterium]|nr:ATP-binding protein [Fibrella sp.]
MKITGIDIGEYRQFKDIKFDFTYPADHGKAGQPLEKVCFIGQSGTGKTTLLNVIWDFFQIVNDGYQITRNNFSVPSIDHYNTFKSEVLIKATTNGEDIEFSQANIRRLENSYVNNDRSIAGSSFDWVRDNGLYDLIKDHTKMCLYVDESAVGKSAALTINRNEKKLANRPLVSSGNELSSSIDPRTLSIVDLINSKVLGLESTDSETLWLYLLSDIENYDRNLTSIVQDLVHKMGTVSKNRLFENIEKWQNENPNPKIEIAQKCLNPILSKFFLEVDIDASEALIYLKTKSGTQISYSGLSTGTKQLLSTAIPIYKSQISNGVVLFDEPERSLFPDIQRIIIDYYTSLAPEAQFFFATHSPIIASAFEPCERFILYFDENGEVKFRNGVAPEGDDPNDILRQDFGMSPLMLDKGVEAYRHYLDLATKIKNEPDIHRKMELIGERATLGNEYNFAVTNPDETN